MNIYISNEKNYLLYHFYPQIMWRVAADSTYKVTNRDFTSDNHILIYTKEGDGLVESQTEFYRLETGTLFLITRDYLKSYCTHNENWVFDWVEFTTDALLPAISMSKNLNAAPLFENLYQALVQQLPQQAASYLSLLCQPYLDCANADLSKLQTAIKYYIDCQPLSSQLTVAQIAQSFRISERTLRHKFEKEYHQTPKEYMLQKKMTAAQNLLLTTDLSVQEISEILGFSSTYYFSRAFKFFTGYSPTKFRQHVT